MYRIGLGIDYHQLVEDKELWLGGILIPAPKGAVGHSDADVLLHAICDAMLGALALGDIGKHFPNNDPAYKGIDSKKLLEATMKLIEQKGYRVVNVDCTVLLEEPKIMPFADDMRDAIANILKCTRDDVSIKATTAETLGFVGRKEGLTASAVALLQKVN